MDVADLVGHRQAKESPELGKHCAAVFDEAAAQRVAEPGGVVIGRAIPRELFVVEFVVKTYLVE